MIFSYINVGGEGGGGVVGGGGGVVGGGRGGGGQKDPPTSFSPVTSTNVGISPQNFLTFSFNPFATLV